MTLPENCLSHELPEKLNFSRNLELFRKFLKNRDFMKRMGGKDATNAILANLRSKIFKIFRGSMPPNPPR